MKWNYRQVLEWVNIASRYVVVGLVIFFISLLFPQHIKFPYEYSEGQSWTYEDLIAPFDFPITKSKTQFADELKELSGQIPPYYRYDPQVEKAVLKLFESKFQDEFSNISNQNTYPEVIAFPGKYKAFGSALLSKIYRNGILELAPEHQLKGSAYVIEMLQDNVQLTRTVGSMLTVQTAFDFITDTLPHSDLSEPDFLLPVFEDLFRPNVFFDKALTDTVIRETSESLQEFSGLVQQGEIIVKKGERITATQFQKLQSYQNLIESDTNQSKRPFIIYGGYLLVLILVVGVYLVYLRTYLPHILQKLHLLTFIMVWFAVYGYLVFAFSQTGHLSSYILPFCIVPVVVKTFFTDRLAFFTHVVNVLICSSISSLGFEFIFLQVLAGIVAVLTTADARNWTKFFNAIFFIFLTYTLAYVGLTLASKGNFTLLDWEVILLLMVNGLLTMLAFPLIPLLGKIFGFTTSISLVEFSDMNRPLLQELALKAPGTLQHSLQVGNLCEAAAQTIGANPLLVKVGALYHDIGKTIHPEFFIENQSGNTPHEGYSHMESTKIIIEHVTEGAVLAKKNRLPKELIDFILTHHGTTRVEYFYRNFLKSNPNQTVDEADFRYPGPKPRTKEQTIMMLADSIEAASRSMKNPTGEELTDLVEKIIDYKIKDDQLSESSLTFEELVKCKETFKKMLLSIYHIRVEYPEEQSSDQSTIDEKTANGSS